MDLKKQQIDVDGFEESVKGFVELTLSQNTKKQSENGQIYDCNPYIVCIFAFTALIHCTLCSDCSHIFVLFLNVFCDRVNPCFVRFFLSHKQPYTFYHFLIKCFALVYICVTPKKV